MALIVGPDGAVQFWNRRGVEYTGLSQSGNAEGFEKTDQIFDAFFTTKPQGSGMGLAISRSIMESHGGRLWATPHERQGATFRVTLPRR